MAITVEEALSVSGIIGAVMIIGSALVSEMQTKKQTNQAPGQQRF